MLQNTVALILRNAKAGRSQLDNSGKLFGIQHGRRTLPHPAHRLGESCLRDGGADGVLDLQHKGVVVCQQRLIGIDGKVLVAGRGAPHMIAAGFGVVDYHAIGAHQAIDQRLDGNGAQSCLTVGDDDAGLYHIARDNIRLQAGIDHLDIHEIVGDLRADEPCLRQLPNDGQRYTGNIQIVNAAVAVAEKRAGAAIHRAERPKLIFLGEPVVGVIGQKLRRIRAHQLIILLRNAEIGSKLAVRRLANIQGRDLIQPILRDTELRRVRGDREGQASGIHQIVLLGLALTQKLLRHLLNGKSGFHCCSTSFLCRSP